MRIFALGLVVVLAGTASTAAAHFEYLFTLVKTPSCAFDNVDGTGSLSIDDETGNADGVLLLHGYPDGAAIVGAGIHDKAAADNLVGAFAGVQMATPNVTHSVTTTIDAAALPSILANNGAVVIDASLMESACTMRADLVGASDHEPGETHGGSDDNDDDGSGGSSSSGCNSSGGNGFLLALMLIAASSRCARLSGYRRLPAGTQLPWKPLGTRAGR